MDEYGIIGGPERCSKLNKLLLAEEILWLSLARDHAFVNQNGPCKLEEFRLAVRTVFCALKDTHMVGGFSNFLLNSIAGNSSKPSEEPLRKSVRRIGSDETAFVKQSFTEGGVETNKIHDSGNVRRR